MFQNSARPRKAPPSPVAKGKAAAKPRKALVRIEDRIPDMTDDDLKKLQANAGRLASSGADAQQAEARRLLPIIGAELDARAIVQAKALLEQRELLREDKARQKRERRSTEAGR